MILNLLFTNPIAFLGWLLAFLIAIMSHEVAHGFIAMKNGDNTAKYSGRMNFNPVNHFDLTGVVMFLVLGFGYAKPVPIDPRNFTNFRRGYFQVSIAGVVTNFLIAFISYPLLMVVLRFVPDIMYFDEFLIYFFLYMVNVNLWLMVFNLLPMYPLDGFRLVELFSKPQNKFVRFMRENSRTVFLVYLLASLLGSRLGYDFLNPVHFISSFIEKAFDLLWGVILW